MTPSSFGYFAIFTLYFYVAPGLCRLHISYFGFGQLPDGFSDEITWRHQPVIFGVDIVIPITGSVIAHYCTLLQFLLF